MKSEKGKSEIKRLLGISADGTNTIYDRAMKLDKDTGRDYEAPKKVSMQSVLQASRLSYELLVKQTKMRMLQHPPRCPLQRHPHYITERIKKMKHKFITEEEKPLLYRAFWTYVIAFDLMGIVLGTVWKVWCVVCGF